MELGNMPEGRPVLQRQIAVNDQFAGLNPQQREQMEVLVAEHMAQWRALQGPGGLINVGRPEQMAAVRELGERQREEREALQALFRSPETPQPTKNTVNTVSNNKNNTPRTRGNKNLRKRKQRKTRRHRK